MKTNGNSFLISLLLIVLLSSCAAPVVVSTPKPINTKTPTLTSTPIPTPTPTSTPTLTPTLVPVYTDLGKQANEIADLLGWTVVTCDKTQTAEDLDRGIFLYREDTPEFFCDFDGHVTEPVSEVIPQYMLSLFEVKEMPDFMDNGYHFGIFESMSVYYDSPSTYSADEILIKDGVFNSLEEKRSYMPRYAALIRIWPLTAEELSKIEGRLVTGRGP